MPRRPGAGPQKRRRRTAPPAGAPLVAIPEMAVEAAAGPGALNEEFAAEKARWYLPEGMIRHEGDADPGNLRVLRARGDSMEPLISDGDRLLVDLARRTPGTGEMAVLWGRLRAGGQARRGAAASRAARAPTPLRQPRLRALYLPRRGGPHRRQGRLDRQKMLTVPAGPATSIAYDVWMIRQANERHDLEPARMATSDMLAFYREHGPARTSYRLATYTESSQIAAPFWRS